MTRGANMLERRSTLEHVHTKGPGARLGLRQFLRILMKRIPREPDVPRRAAARSFTRTIRPKASPQPKLDRAHGVRGQERKETDTDGKKES